MTTLYKFLFISILTLLNYTVYAQISVQTSSEIESLSNEDPVFLIKDEIVEGEGKVVLNSATTNSSYYYQWTRFNYETKQWDLPAASGDIASYPVPTSGGYRLTIKESENGNILEQHICWVFNSPLTEVSIEIVSEDCDYLHLTANTNPLGYYDLNNIYKEADYIKEYKWTSSTGENDFSESKQDPKIKAPVEDTEYIVETTDLFGNRVSASISYTAIAVEALYEYTPMKEADDVLNEGHTETEGSAPYEIRFTDKSRGHITEWGWDFTGSANPEQDSSLVFTSSERDPFNIFTLVGSYTVYLRVANSQCESTAGTLTVTITEMEIEVPNTFTPNGDGANDEFRVYYKSVKDFNMVVFNRWGRKVYESSNPADGWDGTIANGLADPGVYFYIIEAQGYNPDEKKKLQGPIHLIRGKK